MQENHTTPCIHCPTCGKPVACSAEEKWKPFCCERCKLIDLGDWLDEKQRIPDGHVSPDHDSTE